MRLDAQATEYVEVPITVEADPTGDAVAIAIVDRWAPTPDVDSPLFLTGSWKPGAEDPYLARLLVGPDGDLELEAGRIYSACVRIVDNPERPVLRVGPIYAK